MRYLQSLLSFVLLLLLLSSMAFGQSIIKGTVTEAETGNPLPGVNVYLSGTTLGASTDENGFYKLRTSERGSYNLVFSSVGYGQKAKSLKLKNESSKTINISLKENIYQLSEVEVKASNKKWKNQYEYFFKQFVGRTERAEGVTIENSWALEFEENDNLLKATAQQPLKIVNRSLGYKMHVDLIDFRWPTYSNRGGSYRFFVRYKLISPESAQQELEWKKNRAQSYLGSFNHFLKTLYHERINKSDFSVSSPNNISGLSKGETRYELLDRGQASRAHRAAIKGYKITRKVDVEYHGQAEFEFNSKTFSLPIYKEGAINANIESRIFLVDKYGNLLNPISLISYGDWADARLANSVPTNYEVGD